MQDGKIGRRSYAEPPAGARHRTCRDQPAALLSQAAKRKRTNYKRNWPFELQGGGADGTRRFCRTAKSDGAAMRSRPQGRGTGRAAINPRPFSHRPPKEKGPITNVTGPLSFKVAERTGLDDFAGRQNRTAQLCGAARRGTVQDVPRSTRGPSLTGRKKKGPITNGNWPFELQGGGADGTRRFCRTAKSDGAAMRSRPQGRGTGRAAINPRPFSHRPQKKGPITNGNWPFELQGGGADGTRTRGLRRDRPAL